jgi:hypothetical protein
LTLALLAAVSVDVVLRWRASRRDAIAASVATLSDPIEAPAQAAVTRAPPPAGAGRGGDDSPGSALVLVDDMARDGRIDGKAMDGYWYTYSDGTGMLNPAPGTPGFAAIEIGGHRAREFTGGGQSAWGAGLGLKLWNASANSGWNASADGGAEARFDARAYAGIQFQVLSRTGGVRLRVSVPDVDTDPRGGVCDKNPKSPSACFGDFGAELDIPEGQWVERRVPFSSLSVPAWSNFKMPVEHGFQKNAIYAIQFAVSPNQGHLPPFDIFVSNVSFFL